MNEDLGLCQEIMTMRNYVSIFEAEGRGQKLPDESRRFMLMLEKEAGC